MPEPLDLEPIKARERDATIGPWIREQNDKHGIGSVLIRHRQHDNISFAVEADAADATFIAHARADVPALIAEIERLRALVAEWEAWKRDLGKILMER